MENQGPGDGDPHVKNQKRRGPKKIRVKRGKFVGYKEIKLPDRVVQKGRPGKVTETTTPGKETRKYVPMTEETGDKSYGAVGGGKDKGMNEQLDKAHREEKEFTDPGTYGRSKDKVYRAGKFETSIGPPTTTRTVGDSTPEIRVPHSKKVPMYEKQDIRKNKAMDVTFGGSDRGGAPANKSGLGSTEKIGDKVKRKIRIRSVKSNPKGYHR